MQMAQDKNSEKTMSVAKHLAPGENVLARAGDFYATNKRLQWEPRSDELIYMYEASV